MRVALYARVSTKDKGQEIDNQLRQLRAYCRKQKWKIHRVYADRQSGAANNRAEFLAESRYCSVKDFHPTP